MRNVHMKERRIQDSWPETVYTVTDKMSKEVCIRLRGGKGVAPDNSVIPGEGAQPLSDAVSECEGCWQ